MKQDTINLLHAVTGNQLKILIALKLLGVREHLWQIAAMANIDRGTASGCLNALAVLRYVVSSDRYHWQLTTMGEQLPLWLTAENEAATPKETARDGEGEILPLPLCSSSSLTHRSRVKTTTTTTAAEGEFFPLPPTDPLPRRWGRIAEELARRVGCTQAVAINAMSAARGANYEADAIELMLYHWLAYLKTERAATIHSPAALIPKRLALGQPPAGQRMNLDEDDARVRQISNAQYFNLDAAWDDTAADDDDSGEEQ